MLFSVVYMLLHIVQSLTLYGIRTISAYRFCVDLVTSIHVNADNQFILQVMDHSPIRQTFKFVNNFSTVGKSFLNLVKLLSNVKFANFVYFCITREKELPHFHTVVTLFRS